MKNLIFAALALFVISLSSCEKESAGTDETLITDIAFNVDQEVISPAELPDAAQDNLDELFFETYAEDVYEVGGRGYMVELGNGEVIYYNLAGRLLEFLGEHDRAGPFGDRHPHGPCFRSIRRFGQPVRLNTLPIAIASYVNDNYPDNNMRKAKKTDEFYFVLVDVPVVLKFDLDGNFIEEVNPFAHCARNCRPLGNDDAAMAVTDYVSTNFPDANAQRVCRGPLRIRVLLHTDDGRTILVFDADGNFLFQRP